MNWKTSGGLLGAQPLTCLLIVTMVVAGAGSTGTEPSDAIITASVACPVAISIATSIAPGQFGSDGGMFAAARIGSMKFIALSICTRIFGGLVGSKNLRAFTKHV